MFFVFTAIFAAASGTENRRAPVGTLLDGCLLRPFLPLRGNNSYFVREHKWNREISADCYLLTKNPGH